MPGHCRRGGARPGRTRGGGADRQWPAAAVGRRQPAGGEVRNGADRAPGARRRTSCVVPRSAGPERSTADTSAVVCPPTSRSGASTAGPGPTCFPTSVLSRPISISRTVRPTATAARSRCAGPAKSSAVPRFSSTRPTALGFPWLPDLNDGGSYGLPTGIGAVPLNIVDGVRAGPGAAFLGAASARHNLSVLSGTRVRRVRICRRPGDRRGGHGTDRTGGADRRSNRVVRRCNRLGAPTDAVRCG